MWWVAPTNRCQSVPPVVFDVAVAGAGEDSAAGLLLSAFSFLVSEEPEDLDGALDDAVDEGLA